MSSWLIGNQPKTGNEVFERLGLSGSDQRPRRILEIGAGTGLVTIALAAALARRGATVAHELVTTDLRELRVDSPCSTSLTGFAASAIPLIDENIALNQHLWPSEIRLEARVLDWDEEVDQEVLVRDGRGLDVVM